MGIGTILDATRVLLLATGEYKAEAIRRAVEGPLSAHCPASALQLHEHAVLLLDTAAASRLEHKDYYRWAHKENEDLRKQHGNFYELDIYQN